MTVKTVVPRALADRDVRQAIAHYLEHASTDIAVDFVEALRHAYSHISRFPGSGSTRLAHQLSLADLRCWPLRKYPYIVFYFERDDYIDV